MISGKEIIEIHSTLIEQFGGSDGIRNKTLLESACNRPYQTFDGIELYPTIIDKAAAILESIVKSHPFVDGDKRTGYVLARLLLMSNNQDLFASEEQKYQLVIDVSIGKLNFEQIKKWLEVNTQQKT